MAYETSPGGALRLEAFNRSRVSPRWRWAWDGLVVAIPGFVGPDGVIDFVGSISGASVGTVERFPGPATGEFHFADTSSYITFGDQPQLKLTGPVTVAAMHVPDTTDRAGIWVYAGSLSGGMPFGLFYSFGSNQRYSLWNDNAGNGVSSANTYGSGTRNFVVGRRLADNSASPVVDIFVNGQFEATNVSALDPTWDFTDTGYQQTINRCGGLPSYSGVGTISNILVWNRALSDAEIFALGEDPWGPFRLELPRKLSIQTTNTASCSLDANVIGGITHVGSGAFTPGDYNVAANPPLPSGVLANDLLVCFSHFRSTTGTLTSTWSTQTSFKGSGNSLLVSYRVATGADTGPTITPASGAAGQHTSNIVMAFRGCSPSTPFGPSGAAAQFSAEDIGPIAAPTVTEASGAVLVVAGRNDPTGSSIDFPVLSGDGLTWQELVDAATGANISHLGVNFATWTGGAPTLTSKTFDIAAGSTSAVSSGVMLTLKKAETGLVTYVGKGADSRGDHLAVLTPELPAVLTGDLMFVVAYLRNAGTFSISSGWTEHSLLDTTVNGSSFYLRTWYRFATASNSSPTITLAGGSSSPQSLCLAFCLAYRGVDPAVPLGTPGADSFNTTSSNVGPIAAPTSLPSSGAVLVLGARNASVWTSVATLDGDGQTWVELFDTYTHTVNSLGISLVMNHAIWSTGTPTITAKTFVPTGGAGGPGMGKMFVLRAASATSGPFTAQITTPLDAVVAVSPTASILADVIVIATDVWVGPAATGDHDDALTVQLPGGLSLGDLIVTFGYIRNAGTLSISGGWTAHSLLDTSINNSSFYLETWYRFVDGTETNPVISISGGSTSPQSLTIAFAVAARGISAEAPFGVDGADSFNATSASIGPIALPASTPSSAILLLLGVRNATPWTSVDTVSGDGLTWVEAFDGYANTVAGISADIVLNYTSWASPLPAPLTAKTFTAIGGAGGPGAGKAFVLNRAPVANVSVACNADLAIAASPTGQVLADVLVAASEFSIATALDGYVTQLGTAVSQVSLDGIVVLQTTATTTLDTYILHQSGVQVDINCSLDVAVNPAVPFVSLVTFLDAVVNPPLTSPTAAVSATQEMSAASTDTAWLVLLTLSHEEMASEIRVTSDGVPTLSRGYNYSPFPFDIILPDDVEGQPPQAQLRIDNTTQEIIAELRNLTTPPLLTVEIVRSISPDIVEYGWVGLRWTASSYDKNVITGTLTVDDLAKEEFPYMTFDSRWRGLWP